MFHLLHAVIKFDCYLCQLIGRTERKTLNFVLLKKMLCLFYLKSLHENRLSSYWNFKLSILKLNLFKCIPF